MLGCWDFKKAGDIPNEIFPLVIIATIEKFDASQTFIDGGSSYDIMHSELFEKLNLKRGWLWLYESS